MFLLVPVYPGSSGTKGHQMVVCVCACMRACVCVYKCVCLCKCCESVAREHNGKVEHLLYLVSD